MTRDDLISNIADSTSVPKSTVNNVVRAAFDAITAELKGGGKVEIYEFGSFSVRDTAAREGRNLHTGEKIDIPAGKKVAFKASKSLKVA